MNRAMQIQLKLEKTKREALPASLIAVTKYSPVEEVVFAYHAGQLDFGENRVQDLKEKAMYFQSENLNHVRWHFIGHLQTNKVRDVLKIPHLWAIHSIDSLRLVEELMRRSGDVASSPCRLFLQVNTSKEDEKGGFSSLEELSNAIQMIQDCSDKGKYVVFGLMTMATIRTNDLCGEAHRCFAELKTIRDQLNSLYNLDLKLSMGMSQDYLIAKEYDADFVRIGSQIFNSQV